MKLQKQIWSIFKHSLLLCLISYIFICSALAQSTPKGATISSPIDISKIGNTWAVIVGISKYQNVQGLNYADKDAMAFYDYLVNKKGVESKHVHLLINEKAIASDIYGALDWLNLSIKENDRVIFYFSGHGDVETKTIYQNGFLLANDAPVAAYMTKGTINITFLQQYLETYIAKKAKDVILIVDACRSGKLAGGSEGIQITMHSLGQTWNNQIIKVLSAQEGESSFEDKKWGGGRGVFSYYLVKGLEGLANRNADSVITTAELAAYLPFAVGDATGSVQNPTVSGNPKTNLFTFNKMLLTLANRQNNQTGTGQVLASRGTNDKLDPEIEKWYNLYRNYLQKGRLIWGEKQTDTINCAKFYYLKLVKDVRAKTLLPSLNSSFLANLKHKTEQYLDNYITDINWRENDNLNEPYLEMDYAKSLVDNSSILHNYIIARKLFIQAAKSLEPKMEIKLLKDIIQIEPDAAYAYNAIGRKYDFELDSADSAVYYYKKALSLSPTWPVTYFQIGLILFKKHNYKQAIFYVEKALKLDSSRHAFYHVLALSYNSLYPFQKKGDSIINIGIQINKDLFEKDSTKDLPLINLAYLYDHNGDHISAIKYFKRAFDINKNDARSVEGLALQNRLIGNFEESIKYWRIAVLLDTQFASSNLFYLGEAFEKIKKYDDAIENYVKAIELKPAVNKYYVSLIQVYLLKQDYENALKTSNIALKIHPEKAENYVLMWKIYMNLNNYEKAKVYYDKAISLDTLTSTSFHSFAYFYWLEKNYESYIGVCLDAIKVHPNEAINYYYVACGYAQKNETKNSLEYLKLALEKGFDNYNVIIMETNFSEIKQLPEFKELIKKYFPDKVK